MSSAGGHGGGEHDEAAKADGSWIPDDRGRYQAWLLVDRPLIRAHRYAEAFEAYPFPAFGGAPWPPLTRPLAAPITMANVPARMERLEPPRWVHVRFPRGAMFGELGSAAPPRAVLEAVLVAVGAIAEPGGKVELPYRWEAAPVAWRGRQVTEGP